jgi:sec-independent protein translocase protein TatA
LAAAQTRYSARMPNIGTGEIILLLLLALLLFGAKRLPEIGRSLGTGMREFKDSVTGKTPDTPAELPPAPTEPTVTTTAAPREHDTV